MAEKAVELIHYLLDVIGTLDLEGETATLNHVSGGWNRPRRVGIAVRGVSLVLSRGVASGFIKPLEWEGLGKAEAD